MKKRLSIRQMASLGGKAKAARMTKEQRAQHARKMVQAREQRRKPTK